MALNQFGAVMTFAAELEGQIAEFYTRAATDHPTANLQQRAEDALKRKKKIEMSRSRDVTEITLEPIDGLDETNYAVDFSRTDAAAINTVEAVVKRFYAEAAPKINVRESRKVLERCLKDHEALLALS